MDLEKTKAYYAALEPDELCPCARCQNYMRQIRSAYPQVAKALEALGVVVEKPFEAMPLAPNGDGTIFYLGPQYLVLGSRGGFQATQVSGVSIDFADSHPPAPLEEEHFVIELSLICLPWREESPPVP